MKDSSFKFQVSSFRFQVPSFRFKFPKLKFSIFNLKFSIFLLFCGLSYGQQSQPVTQYLFSRFMLNPAAAGADGFTSAGLMIKDQWAGFDNAPVNQILFGQIRVPPTGIFGNAKRNFGASFSPENVGMGIALFNDIRGPIRTSGAQFTYAYHIEDPFGQLSFGLTASMFQFYIDRNKITTEDWDHYLNSINLSKIIPDAIFGVHYTTTNYYAGLSVSNLFQSYLSFGGRNSSNYRIERQYLLMGSYIFSTTSDWVVAPAFQFKFTERGAMQLDVNLLAHYFDVFWGGVSYRSGGGGTIGSSSLMFGIRHKQYHFGYAFDYSLNNMQRYSFGSHELMFLYAFDTGERASPNRRRFEFQQSKQGGRRLYH